MPIFEEPDVVSTAVHASVNLGFLTILQESGTYVGGYLVTNHWGRPLEFRLSSNVQPNRMQQILYGGTLQAYICADLIGKTLVEKTGTAAHFIFTQCESALDLRLHVQAPVVWLASANDPVAEDLAEEGASVPMPRDAKVILIHHPRYPADKSAIHDLMEQLNQSMELPEPFARVREALAEARKMGVSGRG
jgi:hypothetical protein